MIRILTILFCLSVPAFLRAQDLANLEFGEDESLEIITWNIRDFPVSGEATVDSLQKIIYSLEADIYALQEMYDTLALRMMVDEMEGYETFFQDPDYGGLAVIYSAQNIGYIDHYEIFYTSQYWNYFTRAPVVFEFNYQGEFFVLINNHYKCCGDGTLEDGNENDEEYRRQQASFLLENYIETIFPDNKVVMLGDMNDVLTDEISDNVFQGFIENPGMVFADMDIATGDSGDWSYPGWPSHLDHILITDELFDDLETGLVETIHIEDELDGGWETYYDLLSDHRPVGMKIWPGSVGTNNTQRVASGFKVYPNPLVNGTLTVWRRDDSGSNDICIFNSPGQVLHTDYFRVGERQKEIDLYDLPPGYYLVKWGNSVCKFLKVD